METNEILRVVKSLSRTRRMCSYYQVDLHVHSPASSDYKGDKAISPYDFVSAFVERGFDLIAITDHNTGTFIDHAIQARDQIASEDGKNITILPGVELYVSPGVHLLAVLPESGTATISDLLSRLGLPIEQHGDTTKFISQSIGDISRIVHERGGLLIGAHCNSDNGILQELDGQVRREWLSTVDALEINSTTKDDSVKKTVNFVTKDLKIQIPFTFGSDSHNCVEGKPGMWVKMAKPDLTCLRQFIFEPELRIRRTKPAIPSHGRIVGFTSTYGIYADARFRFSPHLNVLLGGRGAGKSAAIDLLRFAFEAEPRNVDDHNTGVFANRIMGFLQSVGEVRVVVIGTDGETYVIIRSGVYEKSSARAKAVFTDSARVYQVVANDLVRREIRPLDILGIEFYGQGEVAQLANRADEQLRLIDENLDHSVELATIAKVEQKLAEDENLLIAHRRKIEALHVEAAERPQLEERRNQLSKSLEDPIFAERTRWDRERDWLQGRQNSVQDVLDILPETIPPYTDVSIDIEESSAKDILEKVREASNRILENGRTDLNRFHETIRIAVSELEGYRNEWNIEYKKANDRYLARLADIGADNLDQVAAEQRSVEQKLTRIEAIVEPQIKQVGSDIAVLENRRVKLLEKIRTSRSTINRTRSDFVDELNSRLGGDVKVDLCGNDTSLYFDAIDVPLQGSGMQRRVDQISLICEAFDPHQFVETVRAGSIEKLTAISVTENNASRLIKTLTENALHEIERTEVPPLPSIQIKREGESNYTDLSSLSVGEKCSAILSIALLSKGKPLIIDQPEDDLDHAFIINSIVNGIRTAKSERQIITATHNPNIPVLGDAEMVFRVARKAGDNICQIGASGGLEVPQVTKQVQSLEGGVDAFERRRRRYSGVS